MDEDHEKRRQKIRNKNQDSGAGHLVAGFKGLSHGIYGGLTSIATQTYSGVKHQGFEVKLSPRPTSFTISSYILEIYTQNFGTLISQFLGKTILLVFLFQECVI